MEKDNCVNIQLFPGLLEHNFRWIIFISQILWLIVGLPLVKLPPDEYLDFINGLCGIGFIDD